MKVFISYCHKDHDYVSRLIRQLSPITGKDKLISDIWYDRNITAGDDFWDRINEHLDNRDVICLLISPDYIASKSCKEELSRSLKHRDDDGILVIPIILRPCAWLDIDKKLSSILATPTDGKPISKYEDADEAWMEVYNQIKSAVELHKKIKGVTFSQSHISFLNDATQFSKSNPNKNTLLLDDIFVYPDLYKIENDIDAKRISSKRLIDEYEEGDRWVIIGEDQSGKTSLLKKYIQVLRGKGFYPIYIKDPMELLLGNISTRINKVFNEQYDCELEISQLPNNRIIAIIDDFHKCKNKKKVLGQILQIRGCIIVVDDIYTIDAQNDILADFARYQIKQLKPSQRNELIRNWLLASESTSDRRPIKNEDLKRIDEASAMIEESLGRVLGKGIMPSYAFFILTLLIVQDNNNRPLDEKITSQGYCYQALIVMFLKKHGVSNQKMDSYINFLTEFAIRIYRNHDQALSQLDFEQFLSEYEDQFYFTDPVKTMLEKLDSSNLMSASSFGNYNFNYPYIYYFFAGKFFAQAWEDENDIHHEEAAEQIDLILNNLHKTSNAYIAVFVTHHTKNTALINKVMEVARVLYSNYSPATMDKKCLSVFSVVENRIKAPEIPKLNNPSENRLKKLKEKDVEEIEKDEIEDVDMEDENPYASELRRSIKTVEVIGSVIKNRAGSLRSEQVEKLFEEAMDVHFRHVSNFLEIVKSIVESTDGTKFLEDRIREVKPDIDEKTLPQRANTLFWGMNFLFLFSILKKTAFSLGSDATARAAKVVCERRNTPASFLLKHTILMWFKKNVDIDELQKMDKVLDNATVKNVMLWLLSDYCSLHIVDFKDAAKLEKLGIKRKVFLPSPNKEKR